MQQTDLLTQPDGEFKINPVALAIIQNNDYDGLLKMQKFVALLNKEPDKNSVAKRETYEYIPISFLETSLDEIFFGQWETINFKYQQIFNEIVGSLELRVKNPITNEWITRTGAGSIVIMQDQGAKIAQFNETKKKNALEMGFPKLKAECIKNAIIGLGKYFGRDLNRKHTDPYQPIIKDDPLYNQQLRQLVKTAKSIEDLNMLWELNEEVQGNPIFISEVLNRKKELNNGLSTSD